MRSYILRRILQSMVVLGVLSYVCFFTVSLMPGDPVDIMISSNPKVTKDDVVRLKKLYGLDKSIPERYLNWVTMVGKGDLGYSRTYRVPVWDILSPRLVNSFILASLALSLAILVGVSIGLFAGLRPGSVFDYLANFLSYTLISVPSFWLAIILIIIFAVGMGILPAGGTETVGDSSLYGVHYALDRLRYLILPVLSLASLQIGIFVRYTRASVIEAMRNDFIRTARSKGLTNWRIVVFHGLRNALIPIVTIIALSLSTLFSGAIITETVFSYQGVGKLLYDSIMGNDFNVAMVSFMITVSMVLIMNLLADCIYGVVDPRISYK